MGVTAFASDADGTNSDVTYSLSSNPGNAFSIDEDTGEVTRVDGLQHTLRVHCSLQPDYISRNTALVDAVFRVFMANSNKPLTAVELGARLRRDPALILKTLSGHRVYKGIRPYTGM